MTASLQISGFLLTDLLLISQRIQQLEQVSIVIVSPTNVV